MVNLGRLLVNMLGGAGRRGPLPLGEALARLVPKVRPRFQYEALAMHRGKACPVFRPLAGTFAFSLVVDAPEGELDVGGLELEAWGADFDILLQRARSNLLLRGGEEGFLPVRPGLFQSLWQDNLDGSRILLPGVLKGLPIRGEPVVILPTQDTLLVAGLEDLRALGWLLDAALEFLREDPRAHNCCPLRLSHFQWEPWQPGPHHPLAPVLERVRKRRLLDEYACQKTLLDRLHGPEVLVAPFRLEKNTGGEVTSCTYLPLGVSEGWLPEADRVGVMQGGKWIWLPWEPKRLCLEPLGFFPERYRFRAVSV